jgi:hypothetical protein
MAYGPKKYSDYRSWVMNLASTARKYITVLKLPTDDVIDLENKVALYLPIDDAAIASKSNVAHANPSSVRTIRLTTAPCCP